MIEQQQNKVMFYSFDTYPKGVCFWGMGILNCKRFCFPAFQKNCWTEWLFCCHCCSCLAYALRNRPVGIHPSRISHRNLQCEYHVWNKTCCCDIEDSKMALFFILAHSTNVPLYMCIAIRE